MSKYLPFLYFDTDSASDQVQQPADQAEQPADQEAFNSWIEYGRLRRICKSIDCYACVFENNNKRYAAFSTGLVIGLDKFKGIKSETVKGWLLALYLISKGR